MRTMKRGIQHESTTYKQTFIENTSWNVWACGIYARVVDISEISLIRSAHSFDFWQKRVRKYRTKHYPCGIVFIIYILRFNFLFIVFNDRLLYEYKLKTNASIIT